MIRAHLLERVHDCLDGSAYCVPVDQTTADQRSVLERLAFSMAQPDFDGPMAVARVHRWWQEGVLDAERAWSALAVIATHPRVRDYREAAHCIAMQEAAVLGLPPAAARRGLASVERHRGVLAFSMGHIGVALEHFSWALERERRAENLANVLACLVRLGDQEEALEMLTSARAGLPREFMEALEAQIRVDPDLAALR